MNGIPPNDKDERLQHLKLLATEAIQDVGSKFENDSVSVETLDRILENVNVYEAELEAQKAELDEAYLRSQTIADEFTAIFEQSPIGFVVIDDKNIVVRANRCARELLRMGPTYGVAPLLSRYLRGSLFTQFLRWQARQKDDPLDIQLSDTPAVWVSLSQIKLHDSKTLIAIINISAAKLENERLAHEAYHDPLTGLANRALLSDRLEQAINLAKRHDNRVAVLFIDLDQFKRINDRFGHEIGDDVLRYIATQLKSCVREIDTVARFGGDEFVAILNEGTDERPLKVLRRILNVVSRPIIHNGLTLETSASIGVSFYEEGNLIDPEQLVRQADRAMYEAKLLGKNRYFFYDSASDNATLAQAELDESLRLAIKNDELMLYFQPKIKVDTRECIGFEALIRWNHPEKGVLAPGQFLLQLKNEEILRLIDYWVLRNALESLDQFNRADVDMVLSINISSHSLMPADILEKALNSAFEEYPNVERSQLMIEVMETSILGNFGDLREVMERIKISGIQFSLDDFGTGYSSLSWVQQLPVNELKIDQSFIRDMLEDSNDLELVRAVLALASVFDIHAVAEGVETEGHLNALADLGCEIAQGYWISRPLPRDRALDWIKENWKSHRSNLA